MPEAAIRLHRRAHTQCCLLLGTVTAIGCESAVDLDALLDVSVVLYADSLHLPDSVSVRVIATNLGFEPIRISINACPQAFLVVDQSRRPVGPRPPICLASRVTQLALHEEYEFAYTWNGWGYDGPLPPGSYNVIGEVRTEHGTRYSEWRRIEID